MSEKNRVGPCLNCGAETEFEPGDPPPNRCANCSAPFPQLDVAEYVTDKIEPALSAEEWARLPRQVTHFIEESAGVGDYPAIIAVCNAALPDSDPRKITADQVHCLRIAADALKVTGLLSQSLYRFADALESYLPPTDG
jgi:hypothetical protein